MANNRLYLKHKETGEEFMLAKTLAGGWYINAESAAEKLDFVNRLEKFLSTVDVSGSFGGQQTDLIIITENDDEYEAYKEPEAA